MNPGRVSVLIACRQHGHWLGGALESVFAQTHADMEAVVANDGSTDSTAAVIREWANRKPGRVIPVETGGVGQAAARAAALARATGAYYVTLDADDRLEPRMAEACLAALAREPGAAVAAGAVWMTDETGRRALRRLEQGPLPGWPDVLESNPLGGVAGLLVRRAAAERIGGLALEGAPGVEDWDFAVRLVRAGMRTVRAEGDLARYRQSGASFSRDPARMLKARLELIDRCRIPDPRLADVPPERQPVLNEADWRHFRNRQVFVVLGLAAASGGTGLDAILSARTPGDVETEAWAAAFAAGAAHAALTRGDRRAAPDRVAEALAESLRASGQADGVAALQRALARAVRLSAFPGPRFLRRRLQAWRASRRFRAERERTP